MDYLIINKNTIKPICIDTHILPFTSELLYHKNILNICKIIKLEELNHIKNKDIMNKIFDNYKLPYKTYHKTKHIETFYSNELILLAKKYYKEDFEMFNYSIDDIPK